MKEQLLKLKEAALEEIKAVSAIDELDSIKVKYSGKKGELTKLLKGMGKLSAEDVYKRQILYNAPTIIAIILGTENLNINFGIESVPNGFC